MESRNNHIIGSFDLATRIIVNLHHIARKSYHSNLGKHKKWARVHFIPNLKDGEFVTLRTPYVLKYRAYEDCAIKN
jgi:hypothetical protein